VPWDDELKGLKAQVIDLFGQDEYDAAERRVLAVVTAKARSEDEPAPMPVFREALRIELRRLLQAH
jgi:hypothetical protein